MKTAGREPLDGDASSDLASLPPDARREVMDFIAFLRSRHMTRRKSARRSDLSKEPFVGMWRARRDLEDSTAWVRRLRDTEWQ